MMGLRWPDDRRRAAGVRRRRGTTRVPAGRIGRRTPLVPAQGTSVRGISPLRRPARPHAQGLGRPDIDGTHRTNLEPPRKRGSDSDCVRSAARSRLLSKARSSVTVRSCKWFDLTHVFSWPPPRDFVEKPDSSFVIGYWRLSNHKCPIANHQFRTRIYASCK